MSEDSRQQRMIERIQEDEQLRGDLGGEAAQKLLDWATAKVQAVTSDPSLRDAEVEAKVLAVRRAARQAARAGASPSSVTDLAEAALAEGTPHASAETPAPIEPTAQPQTWFNRTWQRWRDRVRHWFHS